MDVVVKMEMMKIMRKKTFYVDKITRSYQIHENKLSSIYKSRSVV